MVPAVRLRVPAIVSCGTGKAPLESMFAEAYLYIEAKTRSCFLTRDRGEKIPGVVSDRSAAGPVPLDLLRTSNVTMLRSFRVRAASRLLANRRRPRRRCRMIFLVLSEDRLEAFF